jgi:predicted Fe-Mo cluster-binding NifX family protein
VFDSAGSCALVESLNGGVIQKESFILPNISIQKKVELFINMKIQALICGAISRESEEALIKNGIDVYSFIAGELPDVLKGLKDKCLFSKRFSMPGSGCPKRRCRRQNRFGWKGRTE